MAQPTSPAQFILVVKLQPPSKRKPTPGFYLVLLESSKLFGLPIALTVVLISTFLRDNISFKLDLISSMVLVMELAHACAYTRALLESIGGLR